MLHSHCLTSDSVAAPECRFMDGLGALTVEGDKSFDCVVVGGLYPHLPEVLQRAVLHEAERIGRSYRVVSEQ